MKIKVVISLLLAHLLVDFLTYLGSQNLKAAVLETKRPIFSTSGFAVWRFLARLLWANREVEIDWRLNC